MFKKIFIELCAKNNTSPSAVCEKIGISPASFSQWTDSTVPRQTTLIKIAEHFGVTVDYLLGKEENTKIILTPHEEKVITTYRAKPEMQKAVDRLLEIEETAAIDTHADIKEQANLNLNHVTSR